MCENAVVHGLEPKVDNGFVKVERLPAGGCICIDTVDDGVGFQCGRGGGAAS
ncbi:MAG: hypothetical protein ACLUOI_32940 [Eisenbergiella sp.]